MGTAGEVLGKKCRRARGGPATMASLFPGRLASELRQSVGSSSSSTHSASAVIKFPEAMAELAFPREAYKLWHIAAPAPAAARPA